MAMTKSPKVKSERSASQRLEARLSKEQKELIQRAASLQGRTLTDFILSTLQEAAVRVIQEHEMMTLSLRDSQVFVEALLNPPAPSAKLQSAARRYKETMGL